MAPAVTSKKRGAPPVPQSSKPKRQKQSQASKPSVYDSIDSPARRAHSARDTNEYLSKLEDSDDTPSDGSDDSDDHEFEDVPGLASAAPNVDDHAISEDEDEEDWEDAINTTDVTHATNDDDTIGDVVVSLTDNGALETVTDKAASTVRKGPSKREKQVRNGTHCIHVQALMWHNTIRNSWLNDQELHKILISDLPEGVKNEVARWRRDMGLPEDRNLNSKTPKSKSKNKKAGGTRGAREWEATTEKLDKNSVNMSRGDPTLRLLKFLAAYWRKRFAVTAPGLRKLGYMPIKRLAQDINAWKKDKSDVMRHGERIEDVKAFRELARAHHGSRDVGAQLFTALVRALGLEARLVASLQPAGIGWGKVEDAKPANAKSNAISMAEEDGEETKSMQVKTQAAVKGRRAPGHIRMEKGSRKSDRKSNSDIIHLDSDDSALSEQPSDMDMDVDDDAASVMDVTNESINPRRKFDRDMSYPHYWTEVLSPITNTWIPVDPIVLATVATNGELVATFEPRGKRADQAKQVICYTIAHAADGSAKDVTVRYLKKHQLPGRTKGYRMPAEKIKVYNRKGKVRRTEEFDWFKTVMSIFEKVGSKQTAADKLENTTDLVPFQATTEKLKVEAESLQWYKQSAEFVLERHLRREEAILPSAVAVRQFTSGKGDKLVTDPVFLRSDVVECKTAESWHKVGREIKIGQQPLKLVPMRAVTTTRKREIEEIERETGEKAKQGLFSREQTQWIIPAPIGPDREIPRNAFGNIDVYVPSMVPRGAEHVKLKGTARICRDLGISHAEAVTGFEFGKRMAVPIITGVVIAEENKTIVVEKWKEREAERKKKEDKKRQDMALTLWRKFCTGLRIVERMRKEYAGVEGMDEAEINPFVRKAKVDGESRSTKGAIKDDRGRSRGDAIQVSDSDVSDDGDTGLDEPEAMDIDLDIPQGQQGGGFIVSEDEEAPAANISKAPISLKQSGNLSGLPGTPLSLPSTHGSLKRYEFDAASLTEGTDTTIQSPVQRKSTVKPRAKSAQNTPRMTLSQRDDPASSDDDASSDLSNLDEDGAPQAKQNQRAKSVNSPRVPSKTPRKATVSSNRADTKSSAARAAASKTPKTAGRGATKSRYFATTDDSQDRHSGSGRSEASTDEDEEEEEEVTKPRRTTARTRASAQK